MLPIATPPNAIVYSALSGVSTGRMAAAGAVMNAVCVAVAIATVVFVGGGALGWDEGPPEWAMAGNASVISDDVCAQYI